MIGQLLKVGQRWTNVFIGGIGALQRADGTIEEITATTEGGACVTFKKDDGRFVLCDPRYFQTGKLVDG